MCETVKGRTLVTVGSSMADIAENKSCILSKDMLEPIIRTNLLEEKPKTKELLKRRPLKYK